MQRFLILLRISLILARNSYKKNLKHEMQLLLFTMALTTIPTVKVFLEPRRKKESVFRKQPQQLRRIYTQNIDGLEILAGVPPSKIVYAHGSLANGATCMSCSALYSAHDIAEDVRFGRVPLCTRSCSHTQHCKPQKSKKVKLAVAEAATAATITNPDYNLTETLSSTTPTITVAVTAVKKRTSTRLAAAMISSSTIAANTSDYNHDDDNNVLRRRSLLIMKQQCGGIIKPNITFFGEKLNNQVGQWLQKDCNVADALLVMGTSLSV